MHGAVPPAFRPAIPPRSAQPVPVFLSGPAGTPPSTRAWRNPWISPWRRPSKIAAYLRSGEPSKRTAHADRNRGRLPALGANAICRGALRCGLSLPGTSCRPCSWGAAVLPTGRRLRAGRENRIPAALQPSLAAVRGVAGLGGAGPAEKRPRTQQRIAAGCGGGALCEGGSLTLLPSCAAALPAGQMISRSSFVPSTEPLGAGVSWYQ